MSDVRVLTVDNERRWRQALSKLLKGLGKGVQIVGAGDYEDASQRLRNEEYDLVTMDLDMPDNPVTSSSDLPGMELLRELRGNSRNQDCALIVLTAYANTKRMRKAYESYEVYAFFEKDDFDDGRVFLDTARAALLKVRLRRAAYRASKRYRLKVTFGRNGLIGGELIGPNHRAQYSGQNPVSFDSEDLARRADDLNLRLVREGMGEWQPESLSIGRATYKGLAEQQHILTGLAAAQALVEAQPLAAASTVSKIPLWLQFSGGATDLSVPLELLHDGNDYLVFNHIVTRGLTQSGPFLSRKAGLFHEFLSGLAKKLGELRVLIIGVNGDGGIPVAEQEAKALGKAIKGELQDLGLTHRVTTLVGDNANYANVERALRQDGYHMLHYAGHGRYNEAQPGRSPLTLSDRELTAADLNILVRDTELQLVFLSCCLSARTSGKARSVDFHGFLHALSLADVPTVLGYRWEVMDTSAMHVAMEFYKALWRSFCPGDALLQARRSIATGDRGRDDDAWASPLLLMQNA